MPELLQRRPAGGAVVWRGAVLLQQVHHGARALVVAVVLRPLRGGRRQPRHHRRTRRLHRQVAPAVSRDKAPTRHAMCCTLLKFFFSSI